MKKTEQVVNGTSFHSHTVRATFGRLRELFGEPTYSNGMEDKVQFEWVLETESGAVFTVYDWKQYFPIGVQTVIDWHIGGHSAEVALAGQQEILAVI